MKNIFSKSFRCGKLNTTEFISLHCNHSLSDAAYPHLTQRSFLTHHLHQTDLEAEDFFDRLKINPCQVLHNILSLSPQKASTPCKMKFPAPEI